MKNKDSLIIQEAYNLFKKKRYRDVISLLTSEVSSNKTQSPYLLFLLALSYLLTSQYDKTDLMVKRIKMIDPDYLPSHQLESFIHLKSAADLNLALARYIELVEKYSKDKYLNRALNALRKADDFNEFQKDALLGDFVYIPKPSKGFWLSSKWRGKGQFHTRIFILMIGILSIVIILPIAIYFPLRQEKNFKDNTTQVDHVYLNGMRYDLIDKIKKKKTPVFYYSNDEVIRDFNKAKRLIKGNDYNRALILLNKIQNSNSNFSVKERVEFLRKFILNVEDRESSDIPFIKISDKPYLYKGIFVRWKGRVANIKKKGSKLLFNLLIDYEKGDIFSGIIDVYSEKFPAGIHNGDEVEIEAVFVNTIGDDNRMYLVANDIIKLR
ncbi:MAG: hypothetical protein SVZ03_14435 [Spirochaetota bacterium]|nr:hypothetical protein [Spirochaetota bacterium]